MHTLMEIRPSSSWSHLELPVRSARPTQFIDLTDRLERIAAEAGLQTGLMNIQTQHTTTGLVLNEHEPLLHMDFEVLLKRTAPSDRRYRHDDPRARTVNVTAHERVNGHAHCRALLLPSAITVNIAAGQLQLGRWQRVFFVELDGPQDRRVSIVAFGEIALTSPIRASCVQSEG